ncbi:MAG: hypothetical protein IJR02_13310 [Bacteroidaceae bacterium]|nr:hypothetical protein [Bacteroidaceae bacterium]
MKQEIYECPTVLIHDVELENLMIDATSGDTTDTQLIKPQDVPPPSSNGAESTENPYTLW